MNLRPPGYEPDELPTALLRDILGCTLKCLYIIAQAHIFVNTYFLPLLIFFCRNPWILAKNLSVLLVLFFDNVISAEYKPAIFPTERKIVVDKYIIKY